MRLVAFILYLRCDIDSKAPLRNSIDNILWAL